MPLGRMTTELAEARANRSAAIALAVFTPHSAPRPRCRRWRSFGQDVYATYDPETDDAVALEAAYRTARILALLTLRDAPVQLDAEAITRSLEDLTRQVDCRARAEDEADGHRLDRATRCPTRSTCCAAASCAASRSSRPSSPSSSRTPRPA